MHPGTPHLEGEHLLAEVGCCAEANGQVDLAEGLDPLPRCHAVERRLAGAELVQTDPHELEGVSVQDVEVAAPVHELLGESGVADDGVNNEWVPSRVWDVVGVVLTAK